VDNNNTHWEVLYSQRMEICNACEHYEKRFNVCGVCNCPLKFKARMPSFSCPLKKW
jgi:hypothetical protein